MHYCDSDVIKPRPTTYVKYHSTDAGCSNMYAPVTLAVYVTGSVTQVGSALNPIQHVFTVFLKYRHNGR